MTKGFITCGALSIALWLAVPTTIYAETRSAVTTLKPLLITAIRRGEAHGVLVGEAARYLQTRFATAAPVEIDVKVLKSLPQRGCKRLEVTTRQVDVRDAAGAAPAAKKLVFEVSFCADGIFPSKR